MNVGIKRHSALTLIHLTFKRSLRLQFVETDDAGGGEGWGLVVK